MHTDFYDCIIASTHAKSAIAGEIIQSLWSGYGKIQRYHLTETPSGIESAVIKHIDLTPTTNHPRGWNTSLSHNRKVKSYEVELNWYSNYNKWCSERSRTANCFATNSRQNESLIVMEDIDIAGYPLRKNSLTLPEVKSCLNWLASFHATFMKKDPKGLWSIGTYWHLDTRPEEWQAMQAGDLKDRAAEIDTILNNCEFQTFVHGDAKVANFCFGENENKVAAVDFQYIGGGCGMKDVAYFLGSCLNDVLLSSWEEQLLEFYFSRLKSELKTQNSNLSFAPIEKEWRYLYPFAWADFHRFLLGWLPDHWKLNRYSQSMVDKALKNL